MAAGAGDAVIAAMSGHRTTKEVQHYGCWAIGNLPVDDRGTRARQRRCDEPASSHSIGTRPAASVRLASAWAWRACEALPFRSGGC